MFVPRSVHLVYGKVPARQITCKSYTHLLSLEVATPANLSGHSKLSTIASPPHTRVLVGCSSPFMPLAEHLTALRAWCERISAWSVKTRRAQSRYCRDAGVDGRSTAAMHDINYLTLSSKSRKIRLQNGWCLVGYSSPSHESPNTLRRFALGASNVCLVGENPTCSTPAL